MREELGFADLPELSIVFGVHGEGKAATGRSSGAAPGRKSLPEEASPQRYLWSLVSRSAGIVLCVVSNASKQRPRCPAVCRVLIDLLLPVALGVIV